jgi:acyl-CoA dehydrogenase
MGMTDNGLFELPQQHLDLQARARDLADAVAPLAQEPERVTGFVPEIRAALTESGLPAVMVPAAYGGLFEQVDSLAVTVVREALAGVSGHLDSMFAMQGIGSFAISRAGSDELRATWLPRVGRLEAVAALALTEPDIGSDLKALKTTVEPDGDALFVTGHKSFITNAGEADFYCVLGREGEGFTLVLVPADSAGLTVSHPHEVIDGHVLGDVELDGVRVPADHRIGAPGDGFAHVLATLATFRVSVAGASLGLAERALQLAIEHATQREMFGTTLDRLGGVPATLALSWTEIEMARSLTYRAAYAAARDPRSNLHLSSMAKVGATEVAGRVTDRAVQVMGRFGLVRGSEIERLYREARPMRIYEGSTEVILDSLARQLVKRGTR